MQVLQWTRILFVVLAENEHVGLGHLYFASVFDFFFQPRSDCLFVFLEDDLVVLGATFDRGFNLDECGLSRAL